MQLLMSQRKLNFLLLKAVLDSTILIYGITAMLLLKTNSFTVRVSVINAKDRKNRNGVTKLTKNI